MSNSRLARRRRFDLLDAEEERKLAERIEAGRAAADRIAAGEARPGDRAVVDDADDARRRFVEANVRLVYRMANRFRVSGHVDRNDLVQDGMVGLRTAVEKFDGRKGFRFSTYATWWIRQAIQRGLEHHATTIRIPSHRRSELQTALAADADGDVVLPPELARIAALERLDSLDRTIGDGSDTLGVFVVAAAAGPDEVVTQREDEALVERLLDDLDPETRTAVVRRFGLDGEAPATFAAIAAELGVSDEAARRRVIRALDAMRPTVAAQAA